MKLLLELHDSDIFPNAYNVDPASFSERQAVRAIVTSNLGEIALLWVRNRNHHKLPGGGVEDGESMRTALNREMLEEIGCQIKIIGEVGEIIEYKNEQNKVQTSYCYTAKQVGEMVDSQFTEHEIEAGLEVKWVQDIDEAIRLLQSDKPNDYAGHFIQTRDLAFLHEAQKLRS